MAAGLRDREEGIPRNTLFALAMRVVGALFTGGLTLFLVRYLGPDDYGVYALALGIGGLLLLPIDFGVSRSAARFIAERRQDPAQVTAVLRHALGLKLLGAALGAVVLVAVAEPLADVFEAPSLVWPLRLMGAAVAGQSLMLLFSTSFEALGRNVLGFRLALSESALEVSTAVTLVLLGAGVTGAVAGRAIGYAVGALLGLVLMLRVLGRRSFAGEPVAGLSAKRIVSYAGALLVIEAAYNAFGYVDTITIGALLDPRAAGHFSAPYQVLIFAEYLGLALAAGVAPRLAKGDGREPDVTAFQNALRLVLAFQFALVVPVLVWAEPITNLLFGPEYADSADVLRALAPFVLMIGPAPLLGLGLNYMGVARQRLPLMVGLVAINLALDLILIPKIGIVAGAIGTDVAFLFFLIGHIVICRRVIDLPLRPLAATLGRAALAAAAMALVLLAFGTSDLGAAELVAGGLLGLTAYGVALLVVREFSRAELAALWRDLRPSRGGPTPRDG